MSAERRFTEDILERDPLQALPDKQFKINVGPLAAAVICYAARMILGIFF